jgi:hypothetical protein
MKYQAAPNDSRYIPFTQQRTCCVPTSIAMIMYRNNIPLIPIEELGYRLGLTVAPECAELFYNPRVSDTPPSAAGYGTQIFNPDYEPNKVFAELGIPLTFDLILADEIASPADLIAKLLAIEDSDEDALLCFNHGVVRGKFKPHSGHVVVFDRIIDGQIRIVDASPKQPKWRFIEAQLMFDAIQQHNKSSGGIWRFVCK